MQQLYEKLKETGLPVAYRCFNQPTEPPFIVYLYGSSDNMIADGTIYKEIGTFFIELYTDKKDIAAEQLVEDVLKELGLVYQKHENYIDSEKMIQVVYEFQLMRKD